jgi:hypothetical protein
MSETFERARFAPPCPECKGRGWHVGECHPRETCGVCRGSGLVLKAGDTVFTHLMGTITLVRETKGQSSVDGWEVRRGDGKLAYLHYVDFGLTEFEVEQIRNALRRTDPQPSEDKP